MGTTMRAEATGSHLSRLENLPLRQAKADLKNLDDHWKALQGEAFADCLRLSGLTQKEAAALLDKDVAQVNRWAAGTENVQGWAVLACERLRKNWVIAQAKVCDGVEVITEIRVRRTA